MKTLRFGNMDSLMCVGLPLPGPQHSQEDRGLQKGSGIQEEASRVNKVEPTLGLHVATIYFQLGFLICVHLNRLYYVPD